MAPKSNKNHTICDWSSNGKSGLSKSIGEKIDSKVNALRSTVSTHHHQMIRSNKSEKPPTQSHAHHDSNSQNFIV